MRLYHIYSNKDYICVLDNSENEYFFPRSSIMYMKNYREETRMDIVGTNEIVLFQLFNREDINKILDWF